ncbi:MAG: hypothetical protein SGI77_04445 [Pirellulaceae bacterium]|nr:hypothetical protein [Pirellulaceae bacterium]
MKSGKQLHSNRSMRAELGKRDRSILSDVIRYRLTTNEFLHSRYFEHLQINAVVKITGRLVRQGWLNAYSLIDRRQYFVPGPKLVKGYGLPISRSRPLGPQSLSTQYAVAKYCFYSGLNLKLVTNEEFKVAFPLLDDQVVGGVNVLDGDGANATLRLVRVDLGGTPEHVAKKCSLDLAARQKIGAFNELVGAKRFVSVVLTASSVKQELIQQAVAKRRWPRGIRFQVFVVPELAQFFPAV